MKIKPGPKPKSIEERFWPKVEKTDYCWNWIAALNCEGYGQFKLNGTMKAAHRVSWEIHNGPIQNQLHVLHKCDNPQCINPDHLFLGTHQDNSDDKMAKNRQSVKLTKEQVLEIRYKYSLGNTSTRKLANEYKIHNTTISRIIHRKYWNHI